MTRSERLKRARAFHRVQARQERTAAGLLRREFNQAINEAAASFPNWKPSMERHRKRLQPLLEKMAARAAAAGVVHARDAVAKGLGIPESKRAPTEDELTRRIRAWAKRHAAEKVVSITATTRRRINRVVTEGLAKDKSPAEIARTIRQHVGGMSPSRSQTIARTETAASMMVGQNDAAEQMSEELGLALFKTWTATEDERTRDTHREADGQTVKADDTFMVGGAQLRFPSDPNGPPEEVINCRCVPIYEAR